MTSAENVILQDEIRRLREKATKVSDLAKIRSRKVLTKALVVSVEDVVKLRTEQEQKERTAADKKFKAAERKKAKDGNKICSVPRARKKTTPAIELVQEIDFIDFEEDFGEGL
ncbi:hypothetical protein Q9L58_002509 [Maublancomyces gigas]|uniref:40S ribosomal protein S19-binding protein 1 n=1 Tax=Discina gigas TaxID=1032678 RepID=A0ABR3GRM6_9PEZI